MLAETKRLEAVRAEERVAPAVSATRIEKPETKSNPSVDRLGMGFTRLGLAQARNKAALQKTADAKKAGYPGRSTLLTLRSGRN